jgi:hypothetical protein
MGKPHGRTALPSKRRSGPDKTTSLEFAMDAYRIHIAKDGSETEVRASSHASDFAAIRHACHLAADANHVEIWRGGQCLFAGLPAGAPPKLLREQRAAQSL